MSAIQKAVENALEPSGLQHEYFVHAEREGSHITGCELGLDRALAVARGLALGGWRVRVRSVDPYLDDGLAVDVWVEDTQS